MRVTRVEVCNVKGVEHFVMEPKTVTLLNGRNSTGKTSVLDAIRSIFDGGHQPDLIRRGAKKAEVTMTLDDGTTIVREITPKRTELTITPPDGSKPVGPPMAFVKSLAAGFAFDPVGFVEAKEKDRLEFLLKAMPIEFSPNDLPEGMIENPLSLDELAALRKEIYEERTRVNTVVRDREGTIKTLRASLPADGEATDWKAEHARLEEERGEVETQISRAEGIVQKRLDEAVQAAQIVKDEAIAKAQADYEETAKAARKKFADDHLIIEGKAKPERERIAGELAVAQERMMGAARQQQTAVEIKRLQGELEDKSQESERLTTNLEYIDAARQKKLDSLPIPKLVIDGGRIVYGNVPFDELNTATQYKLAVRIAMLRTGELGLMVIDKAEHLDEKAWRAFTTAMLESGLQIISARVTSDEVLTVETKEGKETE